MTDTNASNKRIAKNTLLLYLRTFITMIVGLYTGRVMLQALGVENYGINNVVAGIIGFSAIITSSMGVGISRFITFSLGKDSIERTKTIFSTSVNAQLVLSLFVAIVLEIIGVWFLNTVANIPENRLYAANWVLQCAIITLVFNLINAPFTALIIAHERMNVYAYMSILEVMLKLAVVFSIISFSGDRLILFAILGVISTFIINVIYIVFCNKNYSESKYNYRLFDRKLLVEISSFSGWNLLGETAWIFNTQGINMLINVFFGVVFNAARGIANTVNAAVQGFVGNFVVAFSPQITKSYASGDTGYAIKLTNKGTKFTWLLTYLFLVPVCCEAETLLKLWLVDVPEWSVLFLRFTMFESLAIKSGSAMLQLIRATGNIKRYNISIAFSSLWGFPIVLALFYIDAPVWSFYYVVIFIYLIANNIVRYNILKKNVGFSLAQHARECIIPCVKVSIVSFIVPLIIGYNFAPSITRFCINVPISVLWTAICCYLFGLSLGERRFILDKVPSYFAKYRNERNLFKK